MQGIAQTKGGISGGGGGGNTSATGGITALPLSTGSAISGNSATQMQAFAPTINNYINTAGLQGTTGSDTGATASRVSGRGIAAGSIALQALAASIQAVDARMQNNYQRSLGADKLGVFY